MRHRATWDESESLARKICDLRKAGKTSAQIGRKLRIKPALARYYCRKDCRAAQRAA